MTLFAEKRGIIFLFGISIGLLPYFWQTSHTPLLQSQVHPSSGIVENNPSKRDETHVESIERRKPVATSVIHNKDPLTFDDGSPRKILLDCGGNVASTVELFRNTYPGGRDFLIHSFEIDSRLAPYFSPYENHAMHCPVGVADKYGNMTAFSESAWSPNKGLNNGRDMQWGGGTLFVSDVEKKDNKSGGRRKLSIRESIPTVDLSSWIQKNIRKEDYVIFKLDVEGAEFDILKKMFQADTFAWIDKYYGEFHVSQPVSGWTTEEKQEMTARVKKQESPRMYDWVGERRTYQDFEDMHPVKVPVDTPGTAGGVYSRCSRDRQIAIVVAVGMNVQRAHKIISIIEAYHVNLPVTLFVYGDFAQSFPDVVKTWATRFHVGMREDGPYPLGHFSLIQSNWVRESLVSAELRLREADVQPSYYLPVTNLTQTIIDVTKASGLRLIKPNVMFPPTEGLEPLSFNNYYKYRDVERIPKALRILDKKLVADDSGIVSVDTDLPDTRMNLVFLLDYLVENSGMKIVSLAECIA